MNSEYSSGNYSTVLSNRNISTNRLINLLNMRIIYNISHILNDKIFLTLTDENVKLKCFLFLNWRNSKIKNLEAVEVIPMKKCTLFLIWWKSKIKNVTFKIIL
jgi:hypothetical protein